ncbi:Proline-rich receptor-like protein kinase PERK4 [Carex littledalei]|uniref:non-specific serine/threonine protein kinase n=1 Tax=Carex littledalei TaxID=544730 RepID=A0A833R1X4_9POAL|nr:Proline-rich receptor-like protein kinase PERK4 [Carex littledalei]
MDWCMTVGKTLWALLTFPIGLPLICILLLLATLCGLTGEFMLWVLPVKKFPKGLVDAGNQLVSVAKKVLECWLLTSQPRIIHRDIKPANILLENSFEAKVADFGLAKFFPDGETHVCATQFVGTRGYLAPEIAMGEIREKSDTYSYGVVLLELITGKRPLVHTDSSTECLADWVWPLLLKALADDNYNEIVDPRLAADYSLEEMKLMVTCAFACVRRSPQARPPMSQVVLVLEGIATPDTLGEESIKSSVNLSSPGTFGTSSSISEHIRTESTRNLPVGVETEYMTACIDLPLSDNVGINRNSSANTSHQIRSHVGSIDNTILCTSQSAYFDAPDDYIAISDDEAPLRCAITHVAPQFDSF